MKQLRKYQSTAFMFGFSIRLILILFVVPAIYTEWFLPFLTFDGPINIIGYWDAFVQSGGNAQAFPYGPPYLIYFKPFVWLGYTLGGITGAGLALGISALFLDFCIYRLFQHILPKSKKVLSIYIYWLSPIILYCTYWHGQLDIFPVLLLTVSLLFSMRNQFLLCGLALGTAIAAKFVMITALPFFLLYLYNDKRYHEYLIRLIAGVAIPCLASLPFFLDPSFQRMVLGTPEAQKVFSLQFSYSEMLQIYVAPIALLLVFYVFWRTKRVNQAGLRTFVGLSFLILFLLTPASAGWAIWTVPFLVFHVAESGRTSVYLVLFFSFLTVAFHGLISSGAIIFGFLNFSEPLLPLMASGTRISSLLASMNLLFGLLLCQQMFRNGVIDSSFNKVTRTPLLLSIAGDSGAGKDTLSDALRDLFGAKGVVQVSGDDYHLWDRKKPMWRAHTHLDPRANNLDKFEKDILRLKGRGAIRARHYDHRYGRMTKPKKLQPRDVIISSGLHGLLPTELRKQSNICIYLDMDEALRRKLKIKRDVHLRGHALSAVEAALKARMPDSHKYIYPQKSKADLVLQLSENPSVFEHCQFDLEALFSPETNTKNLVQDLLSLSSLDIRLSTELGQGTSLHMSGDSGGELVSAIAKRVAPNIIEHLAPDPKWHNGSTGLLQLCTLMVLEQKLYKGII